MSHADKKICTAGHSPARRVILCWQQQPVVDTIVHPLGLNVLSRQEAVSLRGPVHNLVRDPLVALGKRCALSFPRDGPAEGTDEEEQGFVGHLPETGAGLENHISENSTESVVALSEAEPQDLHRLRWPSGAALDHFVSCKPLDVVVPASVRTCLQR